MSQQEIAAAQVAQQAQADFVSGIRAANALPEQFYFGLHLGPPGSGKTHTLGTMPGKTLVLDCRDGGAGTAPLIAEADHVSVRAITGWPDIREAVKFLMNADHDFESVGIDGLSKLQGYDLAHIIENTKRADGSRPIKMEKDMWGVALDHFVNLVNRCEEIGQARRIHFAMTAWEKELGGENPENQNNMIPDLMGGIKNRLAGMFDVVCYHSARNLPPAEEGGQPIMEYACLTVPFGARIHGKCRWKRVEDGKAVSALDPIEINPNISEWVTRIRRGTKEVVGLKGLPVVPEKEAPAGSTITTEAAPAPQPAKQEDVAPAASQEAAKQEEEPAPTEANAAAAAELAASAAAMPTREELVGNVQVWFKDAIAAHPDREAEIDAKLQDLAKELGVKAKLTELSPEKLALLIEQLMEFEETLAA